jgi:cytoskeletal protein CcmA (bactofilin family)
MRTQKNHSESPLLSDEITILSDSVHIQGEFKSPGRVEIWGSIEGPVAVDELHLKESGRLQGNITARTAIISGLIQGKLNVKEKLSIRASARIQGEVTAGQLEIASGAWLDASLSTQAATRGSEPQDSLAPNP